MRLFKNIYIRWVIVLIFLLIVSVIDILTGYELSFFTFYLIPIALASFWGGRVEVLVISLLSILAWYISDNFSGHPYTNYLFQYWNGGIRLITFLMVGVLINSMRHAIHEQRKLAIELQKNIEIVQQLADTDSLTSLSNQRTFYKQLGVELERVKRYGRSFTVAYIDLDNFKQINDSFGHDEGDLVLRKFANCLKSNTREADVVARLGGDEFAVILTETNFETAKTTLKIIKDNLHKTLRSQNGSITCSIGAVTFNEVPSSVQEAIKLADQLMYNVKQSGKNAIKQESWPIK